MSNEISNDKECKVIRLEEILDYEQPNKYIVNNQIYSDEYDIPVLTAGQSFILGYTNETENIFDNVPVIIFDDFTTSMKYVDFPFKVKSSAMKILKANNNVNIKYMFYILSTIKIDIELHKRYWISTFSKIQIPLPPLEIQKQIADELDQITSLIEKRKMQLEKMDLLVKAKFIEMFGDPVENPMGWEVEKLSSVGEIGRGVSKHRPRNDPSLLNGSYPFIQTGEIANAHIYIHEYTNTYSELGLQQSKLWKKGTLCITIAANIAKTAILTFDACFPDSIVGFTSNEKTNEIFIHYWFAFFQSILEAQAPESAQKNINLKILSDLDIIIPPLSLQTQFANYVEQVEQTKAIMEKGLEQLEILYKQRMQEYFE